MFKLRCTIKCPDEMQSELVSALNDLGIKELQIDKISYECFMQESRMYWDYVFPQMKEDHKAVTYISYEFDDTQAGRQACHRAEINIGWIPQNIHYVEV